MEGLLDPLESILFAQVRKAGPSHGHDMEGNLRLKNHPANTTSVWLGDIATTLLKVIPGIGTPKVEQSPRFDEQRWIFNANAGDLSVKVESRPYWGFGLITKCYVNAITLNGPLETRTRVIFDLVASLAHKPWELSFASRFNRKFTTVKENKINWQSHISHARNELEELIEKTKEAIGDSEEITHARNAMADDNAPAVLRALARMEAKSIDIQIEDIDYGASVLMVEDEEIPLVDLTAEEE
ncbi:MAG: hypothetical protein ACKVIR_03350 [Candidatus Poseidoniales archaeon]